VNLLLDDRPLDDGYGQAYNAPVDTRAGTLAIQAAAGSNRGGQG
jgi:hypothetical protein